MMDLVLDGAILRLDGDVLEVFNQRGGASRYHLRYVESLELSSGKKGVTLLSLRCGSAGGFSGTVVPDASVEQARRLIDAVRMAKGQQ